jgi:hypothetical protein
VVDGLSKELDGGLNADADETNADTALRTVQQKVRAQGDEWSAGGLGDIHQAQILRPRVHGEGDDARTAESRCDADPGAQILEDGVRNVREGRAVPGRASSGREPLQQQSRKPDDIVRELSYALALGAWQDAAEAAVGLQSLLGACEEIGYVPEALSAFPQIWRSMSDEEKYWVGLRLATGSPWCAEWPGVGRVAVGVKDRVNKLRALGNAVVPFAAFPIFRAIAEIEGIYRG